ncbi:pilus assembly protein TadG-related protein [Microvirgula aerodenitrificans]|uniref:TadE/TadG family type IV pilus assembly protein n=1 Tax=Microvirgula aerodenitrificans TaxID=57480 RepID=UPI00248DE12D|nr:pilus assembly protein TadG-related protein [Microvirgula aerodenitrificans]
MTDLPLSIRCQRGSVTIVFLFSMMSITLSLFAAIDIMRYNLVQSRMQSALDSAVLAAGRNLGNLGSSPNQASQDAWKQDAIGYLRANMPDGYMGSSYDIGKVVVTVSGEARTGQTISMQATGELPLLVAGFLVTKTMPLVAGNTAMRKNRRDLELVMVLDNTKSMDDSAGSGQTRLTALKKAANTLVDTLFGNGDTDSNFNIGLVPFASTVNVRDASGAKPVRWLKNGSVQPFTSIGSWDGCIVEPQESNGLQPNPPKVLSPSSKSFTPYYSTNVVSSYWEARFQFDNGYCVPSPTTFLTSNAKTIKSGINAMYAYGGTAIATGTLWGWRMLSPTWRGSDGWGSTTLPQDRDSFLTKAMIIMTDGKNGQLGGWSAARFNQFGTPKLSALPPQKNGYYVGNVDNYVSGDGGANLPPYGRLYLKNNQNYDDSQGTLDRLLLATCSAARNDGIKIWTITFGSDASSPSIQNVMRNCASEAYYHAPSGSDLQAIFQNIAGQLSELRLVK